MDSYNHTSFAHPTHSVLRSNIRHPNYFSLNFPTDVWMVFNRVESYQVEIARYSKNLTDAGLMEPSEPCDGLVQ